MVCYIVGAGQAPRQISPEECDLLIAADGGYNAIAEMGLTPGVIMGDFDSIGELPEGGEIIKFPVRKDYTDMHLCYLEGKKRGAKVFYLYGGTGGREDHTFANYSLLLYIREQGDFGYLIDDESFSFILKEQSVILPPRCGESISVFAFGGDAVVSIEGLEYECEDLRISVSLPIGVSNSSKDCIGKIKVARGAALVMVRGDFENFKKFKNTLDK